MDSRTFAQRSLWFTNVGLTRYAIGDDAPSRLGFGVKTLGPLFANKPADAQAMLLTAQRDRRFFQFSQMSSVGATSVVFGIWAHNYRNQPTFHTK